MTDHLGKLRRSYDVGTLEEADLDDDPIRQFERWFEDAQQSGEDEPNAMTLATVDADGAPDARVVLLKGLDQDGFVWFSNYASAKGVQLEQTLAAALVFRWYRLERQVRVRGRVTRTSPTESDEYFATRPLGSRIGAIVSPQSQVLADRGELERAAAQLATGPESAIVRPPHWGGSRLTPVSLELWQGRANRLHDRFRYVRLAQAPGDTVATWRRERLAP